MLTDFMAYKGQHPLFIKWAKYIRIRRDTLRMPMFSASSWSSSLSCDFDHIGDNKWPKSCLCILLYMGMFDVFRVSYFYFYFYFLNFCLLFFVLSYFGGVYLILVKLKKDIRKLTNLMSAIKWLLVFSFFTPLAIYVQIVIPSATLNQHSLAATWSI